MNRAQRRRAAAQLPPSIRGAVLGGRVPVVEITPEQLKTYGLDSTARTGSIMVIHGFRLNAARTGFDACPKGHETPVRINIVPGGTHGLEKK